MNIELLLKVKAAIIAEPEKYDQFTFCGTEFCIAGHAVAIADPRLWKRALTEGWEGEQAVWHRADELLDMNHADFEQMTDGASHWPVPFSVAYRCAVGDADRAAVAADLIDYFIAKGQP